MVKAMFLVLFVALALVFQNERRKDAAARQQAADIAKRDSIARVIAARPRKPPPPTPQEIASDSMVFSLDSWELGGFGAVALASFTVRSRYSRPVKDLVLMCRFYAPSGTELANDRFPILHAIKPGGKLVLRRHNLGLVPSQTDAMTCRLTDLTVQTS